ATARNPNDRYGTCLEMVDDLEKALFPPSRQMRPWIVAGLTTLILAGVAVFAIVARPSVPRSPLPGEPAADATYKIVNGQRYPNRIVVEVQGTPVTFCRVEPTPGNENDPPLFYMMENKVTNQLFEQAAQNPEFQKHIDK